MLKGVTKIELTDINSGQVEVHEESNFITNAFSELCQPLFRLNDPFQSISSIYKPQLATEDFVGGLLLFNKSLVESPTTLFAPNDVRMVGHASDITYSGSDLAMGSFNENQSEFERNVKKFVWDFTSEQGNGSIASVCLTTKVGAFMGYGSDYPSEETSTMIKNAAVFNKSNVKLSLPSDGKAARYPVYINFKDKYILSMSLSGIVSAKSLRFYKLYFWDDKADLFSTLPYNAFYQSSSISEARGKVNSYIGDFYTKVDIVDVNIASVFGSGTSFGIGQDGKYLYLSALDISISQSQSSAWAPNTAKTFIKVDLETLTYSTFQMTNTTGKYLIYRTDYTIYGYSFGVVNDEMFFSEWTSTYGTEKAQVYSINMSDNTKVREIKYADGTPAKSGSSEYKNDTAPFMASIQGKAIFSKGIAQFMQVSGSNNSQSICISPSDFIAQRMGVYPMSFGFLNGSGRFVPTDNPLFFGVVLNNEIDLTVVPFTNMLMTINNLGVPVTKTSAQTMRITYTLTKADE